MNSFDWKNATPAQINLWNYVRTLLVGVQTITPIVFVGASAGSEFETYSAKKVYMALEFQSGQAAQATGVPYMTFYNMANAAILIGTNISQSWDATAVAMKYGGNTFKLTNFWFSRIVFATYGSLIFNGYKITIP
jgi:hypothetical protein